MWATDAYVVKSADLGELKATIREILKEVEFQHNLYNKRAQQETLALKLL
jgi:DNA-binding response OmpR family regulator